MLVGAWLLATGVAGFAVASLYFDRSEPPSAARGPALVAEMPPGPPLAAEAERTETAPAGVPRSGEAGGPAEAQDEEEAAGRGPTPGGGADDERVTASHEAEDAALRAALTAARGRIAALEAAGARYEATIAELRAELEGTRAEARALGERLEVGRRGIEELNAMLTAIAKGGGLGTGGEGLRAGPQEADGAEPAPVSGPQAMVRTATGDRAESAQQRAAPAAQGAAPMAQGVAAVGTSSPAEDSGNRTQPAGAPSYAAIDPVKLRAEPDNAAEVLAIVEPADVVRRIGDRGGWLQVEYRDRLGRDVTGWVYGKYLRQTEPPPAGRGWPSAQAND